MHGKTLLKQSERSKAGAIAAAEHEMVEQRAVDRIGHGRQAAGRAAIGAAWSGVSARVIMGKDQPSTAERRRRSNDVADWETGAARIALVTRQVQAAAFDVHVGYEQMFQAVIALGEAICKEGLRRLRVRHSQGWFGTLKMHL